MAKQEKELKVKVFRNLHFKDRVVWSVQDYSTRRLLFHTPNIMLRKAEFRVSEKGRERVRREGRKTIHAFVIGELVVDPYWFPHYKELEDQGVRITYNPYKYETFVTHPESATHRAGVQPLEAVYSADMVWMNDRGGVHGAAVRGEAGRL